MLFIYLSSRNQTWYILTILIRPFALSNIIFKFILEIISEILHNIIFVVNLNVDFIIWIKLWYIHFRRLQWNTIDEFYDIF